MSEHDDLLVARKHWATLRARFALAGFALDRLSEERGYMIQRGLWCCELQGLRDVYAFAARAGIVLPDWEAPP